MSGRNPKYAQIIAREFRVALAEPINSLSVVFDDDEETITVMADGVAYIMFIGSDDDEFYFTNADDREVAFDFPVDWIELEENGEIE